MQAVMLFNNLPWVTFTPTSSMSTNTTLTGKWRKVGDSMEVRIRMAFSGTPDAGDLTINIPSGYTIDTAKLSGTTAATQILGYGRILDAAATGHYVLALAYNSTTSLAVMYNGTPNGGFVNRTNPISLGAGGGTDEISVFMMIPITGWS